MLLRINLSDETPGPVQLIITSLNSTPSTVLTIQVAFRGLPTIAPGMGPGGCITIEGSGTVDETNQQVKLICYTLYSPFTFNIMLLENVAGGFALITTSHSYILAL